MSERTLLVGQSGGATAVTNATLAGIIERAQDSASFHRILGMRHGIRGVLEGQYHDLTTIKAGELRQLAATPSAALGTSRLKLSDDQIMEILDILRELDCSDLILIGGNDSADTALRLHRAGTGLRVVLAPKTVDNDLPGTDYCPGYPSAARYFATLVRDATYDSLAAPDLYPVKIIDAMGRDAGWLTAAASLAFHDDERDLLPLLVFPERPPASAEALMEAIEDRWRERGWVVCVIPETMRDAQGNHLSGDSPAYIDPFGHPYQLPPAISLANALTARLGIRARFERPGSALRMATTSPVDQAGAKAAGVAAVRCLEADKSGIMVTLEREAGTEYRSTCGHCNLEVVANQVRQLEDEFIGEGGHSVTDAFREYALPLLGASPFPAYYRL